MIILLHSSKAMRFPADDRPCTVPALLDRARELAACLRGMSSGQLMAMMDVTAAVADKTRLQMEQWSADGPQRPALDSFIGDIYSGLHAPDLSEADRRYAGERLFILSGLYGVLRPDDGIRPYRLEMAYRLPDPAYANLYRYWGDAVAGLLPADGPIVNLAAQEYSRVVTAYVDRSRVITPKFLSVDPRTGEARFVVVHAKIARGSFARWLITHRIEDPARLPEFTDVGYAYDAAGSTPRQPLFIAKEFGGKGLSIRLEQ